MHKNGFIHRDIKPANILIDIQMDGYMICKISDYGFSSCLDTRDSTGKITGVIGSPYYMAPEVIKKIPYSSKADIWSLGVIIF